MTYKELAELLKELPAIRSYYAGSALKTVEEDITQLCDGLIASAERETKLLEALRDICAGKMPEDGGRFDVCCARLIGIAQRALEAA